MPRAPPLQCLRRLSEPLAPEPKWPNQFNSFTKFTKFTSFTTAFNMKTSTIIALSAAGIFFFGAVGSYSYVNGVRNTLIAQETNLTALYRDNQNVLSSYVSGFYEQVGIADRKSAQLNQIISDAVKGRYDGKTSAQPGKGQLFSAIQEAYPNIDLSTYDKIQDYIQKSRNEFKGAQTRLLSTVAQYENSRKQGFIKSTVANVLGFPSDTLQARVDGKVFYGRTALEQIQEIVLDGTTNAAFGSGKMAPLTAPPLPAAPQN